MTLSEKSAIFALLAYVPLMALYPREALALGVGVFILALIGFSARRVLQVRRAEVEREESHAWVSIFGQREHINLCEVSPEGVTFKLEGCSRYLSIKGRENPMRAACFVEMSPIVSVGNERLDAKYAWFGEEPYLFAFMSRYVREALIQFDGHLSVHKNGYILLDEGFLREKSEHRLRQIFKRARRLIGLIEQFSYVRDPRQAILENLARGDLPFLARGARLLEPEQVEALIVDWSATQGPSLTEAERLTLARLPSPGRPQRLRALLFDAQIHEETRAGALEALDVAQRVEPRDVDAALQGGARLWSVGLRIARLRGYPISSERLEAVGRMRFGAHWPELLKLLEQAWDPRGVPLLERGLESPDADVRLRCVTLLQAHGERLAPLARALERANAEERRPIRAAMEAVRARLAPHQGGVSLAPRGGGGLSPVKGRGGLSEVD